MRLLSVVRGVLVAGCLLGASGGPVRGDPPELPVPKAPAGSAASADAVLAAFQKKDAKALEAVSTGGKSDPWVVATVLLERGEAKAAAAFAAVAPRPETQALPAFVAKHVVGPRDVALRGALQAGTEALKEERAADAIAIFDLVLTEAKGLLRIQALQGRAIAHDFEHNPREAAEAYAHAGAEADALGWIRRASAMLDGAGMAWIGLGEDRKALAAFEREVALDERRQVKGELVVSLSHLASACGRMGDDKRAFALQERAIPLAESAGDSKSLVVLLDNQGTALRTAGRNAEGLVYHEKAAAVARKAGDREGVARADQNRGFTLRDMGNAPAAATAFRAALEAYDALGRQDRAVEVRIQLSPLLRLLGDRPGAKEMAVQAVRDAEGLPNEVLLAQARLCMSGVLLVDRALPEALDVLERARAVFEKRGPAVELGQTMSRLSTLYQLRRELPKALSMGEAAVALARAKGTARALASALDGLSQVRTAMDEPERAIELAEEARAIYEKLGNVYAAAGEWDRIGRAMVDLGDAKGGLALLEKARAEFEKAGDLYRLAMSESTIGQVHADRGAWAPAIASHERALALLEKVGDSLRVGQEMLHLGRIWKDRGALGRALAYEESAEDVLSKQPDGYDIAVLRSDLAWTWGFLGEPARALALRERAVVGFEKAGEPAEAAVERGSLALLHAEAGDPSAALEELKRATTLLEKVGDPEQQALTWGRMGEAYAAAGNLAKALECATTSLSLREKAQDPHDLGYGHLRLAGIQRRMKRLPESLTSATMARDLFARVGRPDLEALAEAERAAALISLARHPEALAASRASVELLEGPLRGLGDEERARGWSKQSKRAFSVGLEASVATGRTADAVWFLESERGGALLEMFAVRDTLRDAVLPPALREAEIDAQARRTAAASAMGRAKRHADAAAYNQARASWDRAGEELAQVEVLAEREAKRAVAVAHPSAVTLAAMEKRLGAGEALVLYGDTTTRTIAVVVEASGTRVVPLAPAGEVRAACDALQAEDPSVDPTAAILTLRRLLVEPLGLAPTVKRWIISPDDALAFVPFSLLDREREIVLVPSATVLDLLRAEGATSKKGEGVLALGDPAYRPVGDAGAVALLRSGSLSLPIPKSGDEAREVGSTVLVREKATIPALRKNLGRPQRWRSVHLACHGVLDTEHPALSGLALTPVGDDDGVLRVLDLFRLKVDADLVVLSACETARGKVFSGEGILGLTRAFLYAGAPRVIASLWKVDDAATRALMKTFYARWAEGATPAAALRDAQAFVASQPAWKHPHYWAAWTLWGLPD